MRLFIIVALAFNLMLIAIPTDEAFAETTLISKTLARGTNDSLECRCINLSKKELQLRMYMVFDEITYTYGTRTLPVSGIASVPLTIGNQPAYCLVRRVDRKSLNTKQVLCTLSLLDNTGRPLVTTPVDTRYKLPAASILNTGL